MQLSKQLPVLDMLWTIPFDLSWDVYWLIWYCRLDQNEISNHQDCQTWPKFAEFYIQSQSKAKLNVPVWITESAEYNSLDSSKESVLLTVSTWVTVYLTFLSWNWDITRAVSNLLAKSSF